MQHCFHVCNSGEPKESVYMLKTTGCRKTMGKPGRAQLIQASRLPHAQHHFSTKLLQIQVMGNQSPKQTPHTVAFIGCNPESNHSLTGSTELSSDPVPLHVRCSVHQAGLKSCSPHAVSSKIPFLDCISCKVTRSPARALSPARFD